MLPTMLNWLKRCCRHLRIWSVTCRWKVISCILIWASFQIILAMLATSMVNASTRTLPPTNEQNLEGPSMNLKIRMYHVLILSILLYAVEMWTYFLKTCERCKPSTLGVSRFCSLRARPRLCGWCIALLPYSACLMTRCFQDTGSFELIPQYPGWCVRFQVYSQIPDFFEWVFFQETFGPRIAAAVQKSN